MANRIQPFDKREAFMSGMKVDTPEIFPGDVYNSPFFIPRNICAIFTPSNPGFFGAVCCYRFTHLHFIGRASHKLCVLL